MSHPISLEIQGDPHADLVQGLEIGLAAQYDLEITPATIGKSELVQKMLKVFT